MRRASFVRAITMLGLLIPVSGLMAQNPANPAGGRGGGGGRGRAVKVMTLTSSAFPDGGQIPVKYSQAGEEMSPALAWTGLPDTIASFVLIVHDVDAVAGNGIDDVLHWMVWNIPGNVHSLPEGVPQATLRPDGSYQISATGPNYRGPAAPSNGPAHHYVFELYALDAMLDVPGVGAAPAATRTAVTAAMAGHVRGKGVVVGLFRRAAP